jgi:transglutaminase-like putative cysteine protease
MTRWGWKVTGVLSALGVVVALTGTRLFPDHRFVVDALIIIGFGHGVAAVLRWWRLPWWAWLPTTSVGTVVLLGWLFTADTTRWGLPSRDTWNAWRQVWRFATEFLPSARPPVDYNAEWAALFGVAVVAMVLSAEVVAHALGSPRWGLVPSGVVFVTLLVFGRGDGATALTALYLVTVLTGLAWLAGGPVRSLPVPGLSHQRSRQGAAALTTVGVVSIIAVALGPVLPTAGDDPWVSVRGRAGGGLLLDHPLVDIRGRLVEQSRVEMFTVMSDQPSYWRLASLAEFDGITFEVSRQQMTRLDIDHTNVDDTSGASLRHEIVISALPGRLVPTAPEPVLTDRSDLRWHADSASIISARPLDRGQRFVIVSAPPALDAGLLMGAATASAVPVPDAVYTSLPDDLPPVVATTARDVVALWGVEPSTAVLRPYVAALALQDWFRRQFDYDLDVRFDREPAAIAQFLTARRGYCEQFAIAFAAMMRSLEVPARVAVGFTPGEAIDDTTWSVQGRHAHAWPEVWFADVGWVGFEPTPGRGAPGAEAYTGVAAAQDGDGAAPGGDGDSDELTPGPDSGGPSLGDDDLLSFLDALPDVPLGDITVGGPSTTSSPLPTLRAIALAVIAVVGAGPLLTRMVRDRRRRRLTAPALAAVMWPRLCSSLRGVKVPVTPAMTAREVVSLTQRRHPDVGTLLSGVATSVERALYAPDRSTSAVAVMRQVAAVRKVLRRKRRLPDRFADYVRPWRD